MGDGKFGKWLAMVFAAAALAAVFFLVIKPGMDAKQAAPPAAQVQNTN